MFNLHTHIATKNAIINIDDLTTVLNKTYHYSIGIHPWYNHITITDIKQQITQHPQIIAIGECGIDKLKSVYSIEEQINLLKQQIFLSEKHHLPLILHIVKGYNEIIKLKKDIKPTQPWIIHGFNNYKHTQQLIDKGFYLSFGKALLTNIKLQEQFKNTPVNRIFFETDDTNLKIEKLYTFGADLLKTEIKTLVTQINKNLTTVFNGKLVRTS